MLVSLKRQVTKEILTASLFWLRMLLISKSQQYRLQGQLQVIVNIPLIFDKSQNDQITIAAEDGVLE